MGDTHWREDSEFNEGEELELERGGSLVQVGECIGKKDQDLSELVDKRLKEREERVAARIAGASPSRPQASAIRPQNSTPVTALYPRPKPLNEVLGTPTGHYGRATVSNLSPFEQKHQGSLDDNINHRPAKRQKQNHLAPSKNGYAQNLTGATLTLASTRPPSTPTIRYEPLRPSIQRPQAETIDLTKEEGEGGEMSRRAIRDESSSRKSPNRVQKRKSNRSSPKRSGYARNLTGAALTLTGMEAFASKSSTANLVISTPSPASVDLEDDRTSSPSENDLVVIDGSSRTTTARTVTKPKQASNARVSEADLPRNPSPFYSTSVIDSSIPKSAPKPAPKPIVSHENKTTKNSPAAGLTTEQPVTALRIKSRPPRKMMMLMEPPRSRPSTSGETSKKSKKMPKEGLKCAPPSDEATPPEARERLNSHCKKQGEFLEPDDEQPSLDLDEFSSSPIDSGIDHNMHDNFLSRRKPPAGKVCSKIHSSPSHSAGPLEKPTEIPKVIEGMDENIPTAGKLNRTINSVHDATDKGLHVPSQPVSIIVNSSTMTEKSMGTSKSDIDGATYAQRGEIVPQTDVHAADDTARISLQDSISTTVGGKNTTIAKNTSSAADEAKTTNSSVSATLESEMETMGKSNSPLRKEALLKLGRLPDENTEARLLEPHVRVEGQVLVDKPNNTNQPAPGTGEPEAAGSSTAPGDLGITENGGTVPTVSTVTRSENASQGFSDLTPSATDHFQGSVKVSVTQPNGTDQRGHPHWQEARNNETVSSEVMIKPSPKPSPMIAMSDIEASAEEGIVGFNPANGMEQTAESTTIIPPKARVINFATRGPSIKVMANKTIDTMAPPAFNVMMPKMPPPPQSSSSTTRQETVVTTAEEKTGIAGSLAETQVCGPWSRESFDLFGSWKPPPGRASMNA